VKIRLCKHNQGAEKLAKQIEEQFAGLNIKIKKCVKCCKICKQEHFVVVGKKVVKAPDSNVLLIRLKELTGHTES